MRIVARLGVVAAAGAALATAASLANGVAHLLGEVGTPRAERSALAQVGEFFTLVLDSGWGWAVAAVIMGWWASRATAAQPVIELATPAGPSGRGAPGGSAALGAVAHTTGPDIPAQATDRDAPIGAAAPDPAARTPGLSDPARAAGLGAPARAPGLGARAEVAGFGVLRSVGLGALAGAIGLTAAAVFYSPIEALFAGGSTEWGPIQTFWLVAGVVLGPPLGAIGAATRQPGVVGALAALIAPAGAALSQVLFPPPVSSAGTLVRWLVWVVATAVAVAVVAKALRRQDSAQTPSSLPLGSVKWNRRPPGKP